MAQLTTVSNGQLSDASMWNQYQSLFTGGHVYDVVAGYGADPTGAADSTTAIQAAMTAAGAGIVYLPAGTFKVSGALSLSPNAMFCGPGTLLVAAASNYPGPVLYTNTGCTVRDITIDGNKANQSTGNISDGLIETNSITNTKILNVTVQNAWNRGIYIFQGSDHLIQDCTVLNCGSGNDAGGSTRAGILMYGASRIRVLGNHVDGSGGSGIFCDQASSAVTIGGNVLKGNYYIGIALGNNTVNATIEGNVVDATGQQAGAIDIGTVTNATVQGTVAFATLGISSGVVNGGPSFNVTITGNTFSNMFNGIWFSGGTGNNLKSNSTFTGNTIINMSDAGIDLGSVGSVVVANNVCMNCGNGATNADHKAGIFVYGDGTQGWSDSVTVVGNRCGDDQTTKTQSYGLRVVGASNTRILVNGNNLSGNVTSAINNDSSAGTTTGTNITA